MTTKKENKMREILSENDGKFQMRVEFYDLLPKSWFRRFPYDKFDNYHKEIKKFEGKLVTIKKILDNGAVLIEESSIAFGYDVLMFIEDSFKLEDDLFEI